MPIFYVNSGSQLPEKAIEENDRSPISFSYNTFRIQEVIEKSFAKTKTGDKKYAAQWEGAHSVTVSVVKNGIGDTNSKPVCVSLRAKVLRKGLNSPFILSLPLGK